MRTSSKFLISIVIILLASACSSEKKQQKAIVKRPSLEKAIIGSWTTEGSAEQIDDYMMAGYGQQIIFNNDKTFEMGVMMSISGTMPYETAALPVSATFGAEISGKYAIAGNTVTLTYSADSITGHMDPNDIAIDFSQYPDITDIDAVRQALVTHLESTGLSKETLEASLRDAIHSNGKDSFTNVSVSNDRLSMTLDGSQTIYFRD